MDSGEERYRFGGKVPIVRESRLRNKIIPSLFAAVTIAILVFLMKYVRFDVLYGAGSSIVIYSSFAASAFILFVTPYARAAKVHRFVGAYLLAALIGVAGYYLSDYLGLYITIAIVVFAMALAMIESRVQHPPAIGIAFAFVLFHTGYVGVLVVLLGVVIMLGMRMVLESFVYELEQDAKKAIKKERERSHAKAFKGKKGRRSHKG